MTLFVFESIAALQPSASAGPVLSFAIGAGPCTYSSLAAAMANVASSENIVVAPGNYQVLPGAGADGVNLQSVGGNFGIQGGDTHCDPVGFGEVSGVRYFNPNNGRVFTVEPGAFEVPL